jgi:hypothetical protein
MRTSILLALQLLLVSVAAKGHDSQSARRRHHQIIERDAQNVTESSHTLSKRAFTGTGTFFYVGLGACGQWRFVRQVHPGVMIDPLIAKIQTSWSRSTLPSTEAVTPVPSASRVSLSRQTARRKLQLSWTSALRVCFFSQPTIRADISRWLWLARLESDVVLKLYRPRSRRCPHHLVVQRRKRSCGKFSSCPLRNAK